MSHTRRITRIPERGQTPQRAQSIIDDLTGGSPLLIKMQFLVNLVDRVITYIMQLESAL